MEIMKRALLRAIIKFLNCKQKREALPELRDLKKTINRLSSCFEEGKNIVYHSL